jgi:hypothetical protein
VSGTIPIYGATGTHATWPRKRPPMRAHAPFWPRDHRPSEGAQVRQRSALRDGSVELRWMRA